MCRIAMQIAAVSHVNFDHVQLCDALGELSCFVRMLRPDDRADSKHLRYEKERDRKRFKEGSTPQSTHSGWRLWNSWPHHRQMPRASGRGHRRISLRLSAR